MSKLPSIQLYPGDWLRDRVAGCSITAQGLWLRIMFLMHDSPRYGYLCTAKGSPIPPGHVAQAVGLPLEQYETLLVELDSVSVPSRTAAGVIFSRRMVRDAKRRALDRKRQQNHRTTACHAHITPESHPSSSSTSSSKEKEKNKDAAVPLDLPVPVELWAQFVTHRHKLRKPMTQQAAVLVVRKMRFLQSRGHDPIVLLETAIERGWLTVFEPKPDVPVERRNYCKDAQVGLGPELIGIKPNPVAVERALKRKEQERLASIEEYRKKHPDWRPEIG